MCLGPQPADCFPRSKVGPRHLHLKTFPVAPYLTPNSQPPAKIDPKRVRWVPRIKWVLGQDLPWWMSQMASAPQCSVLGNEGLGFRVCGKAQRAPLLASTSSGCEAGALQPVWRSPCGPWLPHSACGGGVGALGHRGEGRRWKFFSMSGRRLCSISKYTGKLNLLEGERQTGEGKIVYSAKGIFKWLSFSWLRPL